MFGFVRKDTAVIPVTREYISEVERQYGVHFPELLRQYFMDHNGQAIQELGLMIDDAEYYVHSFEHLQGPRLTLEQLLHDQRLQNFPCVQMIPFADDGANGMYYYHTVTGVVYYSELEDDDDFLPICQGIDRFFQLLEAAYHEGGDYIYELSADDRPQKDTYEFLPLGSVVSLRDAERKALIVGRGLNVEYGENVYFFDYCGVVYPEGLLDDRMAYFNRDGIEAVYFTGYVDAEDDAVQTSLTKYLNGHPNINFGTPDLWNQQGE